MRLSVSLYSCNPLICDGKMDIYDVMTFYKSCGVNYIEIVDCYVEDGEKQKIKDFLDENGLKVSSYSASNDFVLGSEADRKKSIEYVKECCDTALFFGTNIVRVFAGNMDEGKTLTYEQCVDRIIDGFKQCVKTAEEKGVYLCLENHGVLAGRPEQVKNIIDSVGSPNLKSTADVGNFNIVGADSIQAVQILAGDIGHVHFKDMTEVYEGGWVSPQGKHFLGCELGKGVVDMEGVIKYLKDRGYDGYISIEYEAPERECVTAVRNSINYTKDLLKKYN